MARLSRHARRLLLRPYCWRAEHYRPEFTRAEIVEQSRQALVAAYPVNCAVARASQAGRTCSRV